MLNEIELQNYITKIMLSDNEYTFIEDTHKYLYKGENQVKRSVTGFVGEFFDEFDLEKTAENYAKKHGMNVVDVLSMWQRNGEISSTAGTIIHSYMENRMRGKLLKHDFSKARELGVYKEVLELVQKLQPQADAFYEDCYNKLIPLQMEFTVGIEDIIAGNIDLLCYNKYAGELQIWDYKNLKNFTNYNQYNNYAKYEFALYQDTTLTHYSMQLSFYKCMLERKYDIKIGNCYLVHFNTNNTLPNEFKIHQCINLSNECNQALDRIIKERGTNEYKQLHS